MYILLHFPLKCIQISLALLIPQNLLIDESRDLLAVYKCTCQVGLWRFKDISHNFMNLSQPLLSYISTCFGIDIWKSCSIWIKMKSIFCGKYFGKDWKILILSLIVWYDRNLISHCIDLLKSCHILTARLVAYTMENTCMIKSPRDMTNIVAAAKHIQPR